MKGDPRTQLAPLWQVWRNPLVWRYTRSRLRPRRAIFSVLVVFLICFFTTFNAYVTPALRGVENLEVEARGLFVFFLIVQALILLLLGTGSVASGFVDDRLADVLDYQRMNPMSPGQKIVGYLFGLPVREYLLVAITLPFTLFAVWAGRIAFVDVFLVYYIFGSATVLYHLTGLVAGMVTTKWRLAARLAQVAVVLMYVLLPRFDQLGIHFFSALTIYPVLGDRLSGYVMELPGFAGRDFASSAVPFFDLMISPTVFSIVVQLVLMVVLVTMLRRKWIQDHHHPLSKPQAIILLTGFLFLALANLWPYLTTNLVEAAQARLPLAMTQNLVAAVVPLVLVLLSGALTAWLILIVTPSWHAYARGERRRHKLRLGRIPLEWDEAPAFAAVGLLTAITVAFNVLVLWLLDRTGYFEGMEAGWLLRLLLPLAAGGALMVFGCSLAWWERGRLMIALVLGWILPLLIAFTVAAIDETTLANPALYIAAISPLGTLVMAGAYPNVMMDLPAEASSLYPAMWCGLVLMAAHCAVLGWQWRRRARIIGES